MRVHVIFKSGGHHELLRISLNVPQFLSFLVKLASRIDYSTQTFDLRGCETTTLDPVSKVDIWWPWMSLGLPGSLGLIQVGTERLLPTQTLGEIALVDTGGTQPCWEHSLSGGSHQPRLSWIFATSRATQGRTTILGAAKSVFIWANHDIGHMWQSPTCGALLMCLCHLVWSHLHNY